MSNYRVSRIYLENFKLFDNAYIDFNDSNLIVLDGPNGFGKTSIFDAIELVITGQISRISNNKNIDGREGYKDILVSKDPKRDILIMVEFKSEVESFTIAKRIFNNSINVGIERNPNNLDSLFRTYKLTEFSFDIINFNSKNEISQSDIDQLLNEDLKTFYNLYYYIEQEDRIRYLKKPEKDRMKVLSILFNTAPEETESKKIKTAKDNTDKIISKIKVAIQEKDTAIGNINKSLLDQKKSKVSYETLLRWRKTKKDWDNEDLDIKDSGKRINYIGELNNIRSFIKYFNDYKNEQINKDLEYYANRNQTKLLERTILLSHFLDSYEEIADKYNTQEIYNKYLMMLDAKQLEKFDFEDATDKLDMEINLQDITIKLDQISQYRDSSNDLSRLINELNTTRTKLFEQFEVAQKDTNIESDLCPLCGHKWESFDTLKKQIDIRTENFKKFYGDALLKMNQLIDDLYKDYAKEIHDEINKYLNISENRINPEFFSQLRECISDKSRIIEFSEWCKKQEVGLEHYVNKEAKYIDNISELADSLRDDILKKRIDISEEYRKANEQANFMSLFSDVFESNEDNVRLISDEKIDQKINYIDYFYFNNLNEQLETLGIDKKELEDKKARLLNISIKLRDSKKIYDTQIKKHRSQIIKQIEIPFLIYSGRIIQDYQGGLGILIKENEELDNIRFISSYKTDHDVLNTLSSGQLSALVMAFTLALNKVYQKSKFKAILIDDPVQTMDDINIASFVELLRNEFEDKQLIVSTHESEFSGYIRYKFLKYGLKSLPFNVKDKLNFYGLEGKKNYKSDNSLN